MCEAVAHIREEIQLLQNKDFQFFNSRGCLLTTASIDLSGESEVHYLKGMQITRVYKESQNAILNMPLELLYVSQVDGRKRLIYSLV